MLTNRVILQNRLRLSKKLFFAELKNYCYLCKLIAVIFYPFIIMSDNDTLESIKAIARRVIPRGGHLWLFGSRARGDNRQDSDWDLLLLLNKQKVTDEDFVKWAYPIQEFGFDNGMYFSIRLYSRKEWGEMSFTPFYKNVEQDKIKIV